MNTTDKIKKSWWVLFPFTFIFPGVGFIYIGMKFDNKKWILEGITYEVRSSSTSSIAKAREDSKIGACCVCIIFIFIIFAFVAIL